MTNCWSLVEFPIPMRGNEWIAGRRVPVTLRFPIPMRGNELQAHIAQSDGELVPDPHEG